MPQQYNFNKNHPELRPGEFLLGNYKCDPPFKAIDWKTKRKGAIAYSAQGRRIPEFYPVFVQKWEIREHVDAEDMSSRFIEAGVW